MQPEKEKHQGQPSTLQPSFRGIQESQDHVARTTCLPLVGAEFKGECQPLVLYFPPPCETAGAVPTSSSYQQRMIKVCAWSSQKSKNTTFMFNFVTAKRQFWKPVLLKIGSDICMIQHLMDKNKFIFLEYLHPRTRISKNMTINQDIPNYS